MLYRIPAADATAPATTVTGRSIAHAHRSNPELALVGAGLHLNRLALTSPTIKQCASLVGVCTAYVRAAADIIDDPTACNAALHGDLTFGMRPGVQPRASFLLIISPVHRRSNWPPPQRKQASISFGTR